MRVFICCVCTALLTRLPHALLFSLRLSRSLRAWQAQFMWQVLTYGSLFNLKPFCISPLFRLFRWGVLLVLFALCLATRCFEFVNLVLRNFSMNTDPYFMLWLLFSAEWWVGGFAVEFCFHSRKWDWRPDAMAWSVFALSGCDEWPVHGFRG